MSHSSADSSTAVPLILVINPNSTQDVTDNIDRSLQSFRFQGSPEIVCDTLRSGPPGIESQAHVAGRPTLDIPQHHDDALREREILQQRAQMCLPLLAEEMFLHFALP